VIRVLAPAPRPGVPGPLARFRGTPLTLGEELSSAPEIVVRWPPRPDSATVFWERPVTSADNGAVAVLEIGAGAARALLAADADSAVEAALEVAPALALLKVAHHGSGSSSGTRFLAAVRPRVAAISVGRHNRFGHPDPGALARLVASGATVMRTDQSGALWFDLDGSGLTCLDWRRGGWRSRELCPAGPIRPTPRE
jgi:beta-lactamase superfamily II metal-dependent hydrolase